MNDKDYDKLIDAWLDGDIDETTLAELNAWVLESPENAARFAERSHMHSHLSEWAKSVHGEPASETPVSFPLLKVLLPIAAVLALCVGLFYFTNPPVSGVPVAQLTDSPRAILSYHGRELDIEEPTLLTGDYELSSGIAAIVFQTGVELIIEAPARFQLDSEMHVMLHHGRIAATVPPAGIGFLVETPAADIIDHGTEFAVEVGNDQSSEIHVFKGEVEVQPKSSEADSVHLETSDATRMELDSDVPMGIPLDNDRFLRSLREPSQDLVRTIRKLEPSLYFRMGVPKNGITLRDRVGDAHGELIDRGAERPPFAPGKMGSSTRFEGPKDGAYVRVPDYPKSTGSLSGSFWVFAESRPRRATIASNATEDKMGQFQLSLLRDTGKLRLQVVDSSGEKQEVHSDSPFPLSEWQHIAFSADGTDLRLYLNGEEISSIPCGSIGETDIPSLFIGAKSNNRKSTADHFWHGRIDEFALFDHALTAENIRSIYQNSETVK
ncbi:LamG-like jellyroll fold domain-containing protein [Pelagicoccus mobilis]|uniref:FecR domain-containing protein n=1 Tax=Pelagicoccus mobilis TaxID=415221 RepID=A0A934RXB1_9BACT|nr:LamG-like jellyroll fold domain-containing protein [Pelagicoccus mobilis]MBK1876511.1 FecR domain-containing protein [Pelagicoccus mobilis]